MIEFDWLHIGQEPAVQFPWQQNSIHSRTRICNVNNETERIEDRIKYGLQLDDSETVSRCNMVTSRATVKRADH